LRSPLYGDPEPAAFTVLSLVSRGDSARPSDLANAMRLDLSTVSRHVQSLLAQGFLAKLQNARDGRSYHLKMTPAGQTVIKEARTRRAEFFRHATTRWSRKDFETLVALLTRLSQDLKTSAESPADQRSRPGRGFARRRGGARR